VSGAAHFPVRFRVKPGIADETLGKTQLYGTKLEPPEQRLTGQPRIGLEVREAGEVE